MQTFEISKPIKGNARKIPNKSKNRAAGREYINNSEQETRHLSKSA